MAFDRSSNKLERLAGGIHSLQYYVTADAIATVTASGYFNSLTNELKQFDVILVVASSGGTPTVDILIVTSATGAVTVTTSALEGVTTS